MSLPTAVNGTSVTIGGLAAPILSVGIEPANNPSNYIVAQVPVNLAIGPQAVIVKNSNGSSNSWQVTVAAQAPALYFDSLGAIVVRVASFELVRPDKSARAGEALARLSTGLGQTTPPLATGEIPASAGAITQATTLTIGERPAVVVGSTTIPGFPGFYITLFQTPAGVTPGNAPVVLRLSGATSNTVLLPSN
jgi:uncharacterized protein (TIGR03437 family)